MAIYTKLDDYDSPGNPISNINGGCLGYFSAQTVRSKTLIVHK